MSLYVITATYIENFIIEQLKNCNLWFCVSFQLNIYWKIGQYIELVN